MSEIHTKTAVVYEVLQGRTVVCSAKMGLTKQQAKNKIENERRRMLGGNDWSIRAVPVQMEQK
jgi:hypothetical protein